MTTIICWPFIGGGSLLRLTWTMHTATWLNYFLRSVSCFRWTGNAPRGYPQFFNLTTNSSPTHKVMRSKSRGLASNNTGRSTATWLTAALKWKDLLGQSGEEIRAMQRTLDRHEKGSLHNKGRVSGGERPLLVCFPLVNPTPVQRFWQIVSHPMHAQVMLFLQPFGSALYDWQLICQVFQLLQAIGSFRWFCFSLTKLRWQISKTKTWVFRYQFA